MLFNDSDEYKAMSHGKKAGYRNKAFEFLPVCGLHRMRTTCAPLNSTLGENINGEINGKI